MDSIVLRNRRFVRSFQAVKDPNPFSRILLSPIIVFVVTTILYCSLSRYESASQNQQVDRATEEQLPAAIASVSLPTAKLSELQ